MSLDYVAAAFKQLDALNEEAFDTSFDGINKLADFKEQDNATDLIKVIDPDAETEDDLQDSYVGKVIVTCNVCHSNIFKVKEDIVIDTDGFVNVEEQCPYCGEEEGFTVQGEIVPFQKAEDEPTDDDTAVEDPAVTVDGEDAAEESPVAESFEGDDNNEESDELNESVNNVNVETDDSIVNVHTEDNGKVVVTTEPKDASIDADLSDIGGDEMIAPLSDETQSEIEADNGLTELEAAEDSEAVDEISADSEADDEEVDMDIEEVDEEGFDELGESYLKNVYENVESFKTTSVSSTDSKIIFEGFISFKSGVKKKTGFIFEAQDITSDGKVRFIGENTQLSRGKKSFSLSGRVDNKKLLPESFSYNYRAKNAEGKSSRIHGTINRSK